MTLEPKNSILAVNIVMPPEHQLGMIKGRYLGIFSLGDNQPFLVLQVGRQKMYIPYQAIHSMTTIKTFEDKPQDIKKEVKGYG